MRYPQVLAVIEEEPWAILPSKFREIRSFVRAKAFAADDAETPSPEMAAGPRGGDYQMIGRVALVPIMGTILQRCGPLERTSGCTSAEEVGATIDALAADKGVRSIVLAIDSPGGMVRGTPELAERVARASGQKKVVAVADSLAASAAYWVASQAGECYASTSAMVGSIGVIMAHTDESKADEMAGLKTTIVSAGKYKAEDYLPLTEEAVAYTQGMVDQVYGAFVKAVAKGRGVTEATARGESFGQGRILCAADAKSAGMVDGVATLETVLRRLGASGDSGGGASAESGRTALAARLAARARAVELDAI